MRIYRLFSLMVVIGAMVLAIALVSNTGAAATQGAPIDGTLSLNPHDPRSSASDAVPALDMEQARLSWRARAAAASAQNVTSHTLNQQTRDAIQARWLAQHGDDNRTCVLLCGGQ